MTLFEAFFLGVVQGLTEALPISSTAHIVITSYLFGLQFDGLTFEIFLHLASVIAIIIYFRKDIIDLIKGFFAYFSHKTAENKVYFRFGLYILGATFVTGVLGIMFEGAIHSSIKTPSVIASSLTVTGLFLIFIERFRKVGNKTEETMTWVDSIVVALAQTLAVLPGISRSGSTLVAGLLRGLNRETAVRFSFLLAIPVILGSSVMELNNITLELVREAGVLNLAIAFTASFIFSIIGIVWLLNFLQKSKLIYFAIYCFLLAAFVYFYIDPQLIFEVK